MLKPSSHPKSRDGFAMTEVLVTIAILTVGLLGLAGLQLKASGAEMEAYQRAQGLILIGDMADRLRGGAGSAADPQAAAAPYITTTPLGTGNTPGSCSALTGAARDLCDWSNALLGSSEVSAGGSNVGAMIGARGCIEQIQAQNLAAGVCTPAAYRVSVVWQGLNRTFAPVAALTCGQGLYGDETLRRVLTTQVTLGIPSCS